MAKTMNEFQPDYIVSPGEILEEVLDTKNIKKIEFAERCGRSPKAISQILNGKAPITPELAIRFHRVLGSSPALWNNLEANYRLYLAKRKEQKNLKQQVAWAKGFPIRELVKLKIFDKPASDIEITARILDFFGVGSVAAWEQRYAKVSLNFRHSKAFRSDPKALAAWLRIGTTESEKIDTLPYNPAEFRIALDVIRATTEQEPDIFEPVIKESCKEAGVAVVFFPEFKKISLSGMTRWLNKDKALIMMSLRHKSDDQFWFTFFHEAAHIFLHSKHSKKKIFIDDRTVGEDDELEEEANRFAAHFLINPIDYAQFVETNKKICSGAIIKFAKNIGVAPGIVVGRLQRDKKIPFSWHNGLKERFEFNTPSTPVSSD